MKREEMSRIWIDADAIPNTIKEILYRVAKREQITITFVANQWLTLPPSPYLKSIQVLSGFDEADNEILRLTERGDLVVTADIPLASEVLEKGGSALNPRGFFYESGSIEAQLTMREFHDNLRASGIQTAGPKALTPKDRQAFSNALDCWLRDYHRARN